jgi:hypothetical protein
VAGISVIKNNRKWHHLAKIVASSISAAWRRNGESEIIIEMAK